MKKNWLKENKQATFSPKRGGERWRRLSKIYNNELKVKKKHNLKGKNERKKEKKEYVGSFHWPF